MKTNQIQMPSNVNDTAYIEIWKADQAFLQTRWNIVMFFMSASFLIFAYSFQIVPLRAFAVRLFGLLIYWFAVLMHLYYNQHTKFLRQYLRYLEETGHTTLNIQTKIAELRKGKYRAITGKMLFCLGLIYSIGTVLLFILQI